VAGGTLVAATNHARRTDEVNEYMRKQGLVRPREGRVLGGVCAGLGRRFGLSPWVARVLFILVLMVIPGIQLFVYPFLWALMRSV
jgi:phage shock protein C